MANFDPAAKLVLHTEGGYQNYSDDRGNYNSLNQLVGTKCGISAPIYEKWIKRVPTVADMKAITPGIALQIYKAWYWDAYKIGTIKDQFIANHIFDMYVNMNPSDASDIVQDAINAVIPGMVKNDKIIGPATINAINVLTSQGKAKQLNKSLYDFQVVKYKIFGGQFLQSWLNRATVFENWVDQNKGSIGLISVALLVGIGLLVLNK